VVDDRFFSLAEMEAFLETQDRAEEAKLKMGRNLGQFEMAEEVCFKTQNSNRTEKWDSKIPVEPNIGCKLTSQCSM
jgi:hypothetical protein